MSDKSEKEIGDILEETNGVHRVIGEGFRLDRNKKINKKIKTKQDLNVFFEKNDYFTFTFVRHPFDR